MNKRSDVALLLLRLVCGLIFLPHGYVKVFGEGGVSAFAHDLPGFGIPAFLGYLAAYAEFFGAILLILGLFTRLPALLLAGTMAVAVLVVQLPDALNDVPPGAIKAFVALRGIEMPFALFAIAFAIVLLGPGRISVDHALKLEERVLARLRRAKTESGPKNAEN
jgi:putative oxidoreductase